MTTVSFQSDIVSLSNYLNETRTTFADTKFWFSVFNDNDGMLKCICLNATSSVIDPEEVNDEDFEKVVVELSLSILSSLLKSSAKNNKLTKTLRE